MALKRLSSHEECSCVSPDTFQGLTSNHRLGLEILHQIECLITDVECKRIGRTHDRDRCIAVAKIILAKSVSESWKICKICKKYQLLDRDDIKLIKGLEILHQREGLITEAEYERIIGSTCDFHRCIVVAQIILAKSVSASWKICETCEKQQWIYGEYIKQVKVLVDVYNKEQLVTRELAEKVAADVHRVRNWVEVALSIDGDTAARIADILDTYGFSDVVRNIRFLVDVYHKEQLLTSEEARKTATNVRRWIENWIEVAVTKDVDTAARIANLSDKYEFNDVARRIRVLVDVYHKEKLLTSKEAGEVAWDWENRWIQVAVTNNGDTAARIADILDKYGFNGVARHIKIFVDEYRKEQLLTRMEAEEVIVDVQGEKGMWESKCAEVAVTKDGDTAAQRIRVLVDVYHMEQLVTKEEAEEVATEEWMWTHIAVTKDGDTAARIADILAKYGFSYIAQCIRVLVDVYHKEQLVTKVEAEKVLSDPRDTGVWVDFAATKDVDTAARIADILDKYGINEDAHHIRLLVDVYHKEQLLTREEAEKVAAVLQWEDDCTYNWVEAAVTKDGDTAARIADILDMYGFKYNVAGHIRVLVDVYHKEQLVTKEEAEEAPCCDRNVWVWASVNKDVDTAARIADILDKYGFNNVAGHIRVLVDVYHKEQLLTKEEAENSAYLREWRWSDLFYTKDGDTSARIADSLEKYGCTIY